MTDCREQAVFGPLMIGPNGLKLRQWFLISFTKRPITAVEARLRGNKRFAKAAIITAPRPQRFTAWADVGDTPTPGARRHGAEPVPHILAS